MKKRLYKSIICPLFICFSPCFMLHILATGTGIWTEKQESGASLFNVSMSSRENSHSAVFDKPFGEKDFFSVEGVTGDEDAEGSAPPPEGGNAQKMPLGEKDWIICLGFALCLIGKKVRNRGNKLSVLSS
ncbi:MAG: hypothetical protein LUG18_00305 [Candidatus Azobacteroides sp.]|nr:hypothetical protein [Candidatus Azobacteroides sp.]